MTEPSSFDPRITPFKSDMAASYLKGQVDAKHYSEGTLMEVVCPVLDMLQSPFSDKGLITQALFGETMIIYDRQHDWCWGQLVTDGYVGWVRAAGLKLHRQGPDAQARVNVVRSFVYPTPSIKTVPLCVLSFGARVQCVQCGETVPAKGTSLPMCAVAPRGFMIADHLKDTDKPVADWVALAELFLNVPYLWGGRSSVGLDCSALVQLSLATTGLIVPRDSDMQERELGESLPLISVEKKALKRGDLVFWKGHVAIMQDEKTCLHANAITMKVTSDPLLKVQNIIAAAGGGGITSVKRVIASVKELISAF
jgi:cell wall-associated NlpC family hydrolase